MLDLRLVEDIASRLQTDEGLVEKDWYVVRAIGVLATIDTVAAQPVFSGGTSLSKAWGLLRRFSEDIDFKVIMQPAGSATQDRRRRSAYLDTVLATLNAAGFELSGDAEKGNSNRFFSADFAYPSQFKTAAGLRPHLRIEMTFTAPAIPPVERPIQSLIAETLNQPPEVTSFLSVDPIETAADKLSALAWRVCIRERGSEKDDPTIIRHLHDLAALEHRVSAVPVFKALVGAAMTADTGRGGGRVPTDPEARFAVMLSRLRTDPLWATEYDEFIHDTAFGNPDERITFTRALEASARLVAIINR